MKYENLSDEQLFEFAYRSPSPSNAQVAGMFEINRRQMNAYVKATRVIAAFTIVAGVATSIIAIDAVIRWVS